MGCWALPLAGFSGVASGVAARLVAGGCGLGVSACFSVGAAFGCWASRRTGASGAASGVAARLVAGRSGFGVSACFSAGAAFGCWASLAAGGSAWGVACSRWRRGWASFPP
ncbi:hypothetical protein LZK73_11240 [Neorhizobium galegae]|nr:hypothetical protein LZK73_11240 [Neorhizobium galegae]